jgi:CBS domain containing-hemolysin-like protein
MFPLFIAVLIVLTVSGLTSAIEAALFAVPYSRVLAAVEQHRVGSHALKKIKDRMHTPIMTIVIVNNVSNIVGSITVGSIAADVFGESSIGIFSAVLTFLVIVFAEVVPKTLGERHAIKLSLAAAGPLLTLTRLLSPAIWVIETFTSPWTGVPRVVTTSEEEIKALTKLGKQTGVIEADESELIHKVFRLNDITAWDMMTPWLYAEALDGRQTVGELKRRVAEIKHSRVPVFEELPNKIVGVVHVRALLEALVEGRVDAPVSSLMHEAKFVPESAVGDALLEHFQKNEDHFSVVVDSLGNVVGIISLEDVLEELVGELVHEAHVDPERIKRVSKTEILVDAETEVQKINIFFNTHLPSDGRVGDLILKEVGRIPKEGEIISFEGLDFLIEKASPRHVEQIRIRKPEGGA